MKRFTSLLIGTLLFSSSVVAATDPTENTEASNEKAFVHVYRPARLVGWGWNFHFKVNGQLTTNKVKNGKHFVVEVEPGTVLFQMKKKNSIEMELEPNKHYYLRASLTRNMLIGRPELVEVTSTYAQKELVDLE